MESPERADFNEGRDVVVGVSDMELVCQLAVLLESSGYNCIELCGAFGEEGVRRVIEATGGRVAVGHVVHLPEMDENYRRLFG